MTTPEGWTIPQTSQLYDYDLLGRTRRQRQSSGLDGSNPVQSVYDGAGRRVALKVGGQVTQVMVYDVAGYSQATGPWRKYAGMEADKYTGMSRTLWREFDLVSGRRAAPGPCGGSMKLASPQSFNRRVDI